MSNFAIIPIDSVHEGSVLIADDGFTCLDDHEKCVVKSTPGGGLYIQCREGTHYLWGQEDDNGNYVGFWHEGTEP